LPTARAIRGVVDRPFEEPERDILAFITTTKTDPKPYRWVKSADAIPTGVERFRLRAFDVEPDDTPPSETSGAGHQSMCFDESRQPRNCRTRQRPFGDAIERDLIRSGLRSAQR
jgi:hypothetical protein